MGRALQKLVSLGSPALSPDRADLGGVTGGGIARRAELTGMLRARNGFFAFESALHVFPAGPTQQGHDLAAWNAPTTWRDVYGPLLPPDVLVFATDLFGGGFALAGEQVVSLDPETGELEVMASSLEGWANTILDDMEVLTGYPLAAEWQRKHGALRPGQRLVPITPFVLGGEFELANLRVCDSVAAMRRYGLVAAQLVDAPEGANVEIVVPPLPAGPFVQ